MQTRTQTRRQTRRKTRTQFYKKSISLGNWYLNNVVNILFLVVKSLELTSGFISKLMKKIARWRHSWNVWHLIVKTKISSLFGCPQGPQGCQKMRYYPLKSDLEVWCSNIQPKIKKLWNSVKNQSVLMASEVHSVLVKY